MAGCLKIWHISKFKNNLNILYSNAGIPKWSNYRKNQSFCGRFKGVGLKIQWLRQRSYPITVLEKCLQRFENFENPLPRIFNLLSGAVKGVNFKKPI